VYVQSGRYYYKRQGKLALSLSASTVVELRELVKNCGLKLQQRFAYVSLRWGRYFYRRQQGSKDALTLTASTIPELRQLVENHGLRLEPSRATAKANLKVKAETSRARTYVKALHLKAVIAADKARKAALEHRCGKLQRTRPSKAKAKAKKAKAVNTLDSKAEAAKAALKPQRGKLQQMHPGAKVFSTKESTTTAGVDRAKGSTASSQTLGSPGGGISDDQRYDTLSRAFKSMVKGVKTFIVKNDEAASAPPVRMPSVRKSTGVSSAFKTKKGVRTFKMKKRPRAGEDEAGED
jgi:hypothetical protein